MSCSGTGYIRSISPESSAATRVASLAIGVKTARSTLSVRFAWFHQSSLGSSTTRLSCTHSTTLNGPVPLAWVLAKLVLPAPRTTSKASFSSMYS